jgi:hypothetical protein
VIEIPESNGSKLGFDAWEGRNMKMISSSNGDSIVHMQQPLHAALPTIPSSASAAEHE